MTIIFSGKITSVSKDSKKEFSTEAFGYVMITLATLQFLCPQRRERIHIPIVSAEIRSGSGLERQAASRQHREAEP